MNDSAIEQKATKVHALPLYLEVSSIYAKNCSNLGIDTEI